MENLLYLNQFTAIITQDDYYVFEKNGSFAMNENRYKLNNAQVDQLKEMIKGKAFDKEILIEVWSQKIIDDFINDKILITQQQDITSFHSRMNAYFELEGVERSKEILDKSRVMILGCGSIGTHVAWNMAAMGVGELILVDFDVVEESNLNRQILFDKDDIGKYKANVLQEKLSKVDLTGKVIAENIKVSSLTMLKELCLKYQCDLIIRSADNPEELAEWLDIVCKEYGLKSVGGFMTGTYFAVGPTFLGHSKAHGISDIFPHMKNSNIITGLRPSLACQCSYASALISVEATRILLNLKDDLQYVDKICFEDPLQSNKMDVVAIKSKLETNEEDKNNFSSNILTLCMVILIIYSVYHNNIFFWCGAVIILFSSVAIYTVPSKAACSAFNNSILYFLPAFILIIINNRLINFNQELMITIPTIFYIFSVYSLFILLEVALVYLFSYIKQRLLYGGRKEEHEVGGNQ